ncbi:MAG: hypothetical protein ACLFWB_06840 [Armatimonadota bacterium]
MEPAPALNIALAIISAYLATYGLGALLCLPVGISFKSWFERLGIFCGVGTVVLGWVAYLMLLSNAALVLTIFVWCAGAAGVGIILCQAYQGGDDESDIPRRAIIIALGGMVIALLIQRVIGGGQVWLTGDGALACRRLWPDLLYRQGIVKELMVWDGALEWPWLSGVALDGTSMLRFCAMASTLSAGGLSAGHYQHVAMWYGLFGIPVSAAAIFALFRLFDVSPAVAGVGVVITACFGNPRWLMAERFAHSPSLVWAGNEVFSFVFPALYAGLYVIFRTARDFSWLLGGLAVVMLGSLTGFGPWFSLPVIGGAVIWLVYCLISRRDGLAAVVLAVGAVAGMVTLRVVCGTGEAGGSLLSAIGASPVIRSMSWAFPLLEEPIGEQLSASTPVAAMQLVRYGVVYACAAAFFILGSLWVRALFFFDSDRWNWHRLKRPTYSLAACMVVAASAAVLFVDFRQVSYEYADYDMLRLAWVPLLFANIAFASYLYRRRHALRRPAGILAVCIILVLGGWEYTHYMLDAEILSPTLKVVAPDTAAIRFINRNSDPADTILLDPDYRPGVENVISHDWGYVSGLAVPSVWLDNRDMSYKFAQQEIWDERHEEYREAWSDGDPQKQEEFLRRHGIDWIVVQDQQPPLAEGIAAEAVFEQGQTRVYEVMVE